MCSVSDTSSVCKQSSVCSQSAVVQNIGGCVCSSCSNDLTRIIFNTTTNTSHVTEVDS